MTTAKRPPADAETARRTSRADATADAIQAALTAAGGAVTCQTRRGQDVTIREVRRCTGDGTTWVEVWLGGDVEGGDPHFRIFNPPQLVEDPHGDVVHAGRRFRHDPVAALAEVVASNGGARRKGRRR